MYTIAMLFVCTVGDPRGVRCCSTYGDSFIQVMMVLHWLYRPAVIVHSWRKSDCVQRLLVQTPRPVKCSCLAVSTMETS